MVVGGFKRKKFGHYFKLMRIKHYIKNLIILIPIFFNRSFFDPKALRSVIWGVLAFCFASSGIYIFNDLRDRELDRLHPKKKDRPLAKGEVTIVEARILIAINFILSIICQMTTQNMRYFYIIGLFVVMNIGYSTGLKKVPIVDVFILSVGYVLRVWYGGALVHVEVSEWLYMIVLSGAFYFGLGKRREECKTSSNTRDVLKKYSYEFLDKNMYVFMGLTIAFYSLWAANHFLDMMKWTIPFFITILLRYSLDIETYDIGDPMEVILGDKILFCTVFIYGICLFVLLYV